MNSLRGASFDHLVGAGEHGWRNIKADGLRGIEIDHHLEPGWLLDRKAAGVSTAHALVDIGGRPPPQVGTIRAIADEPAGLGKFAQLGNHGQAIGQGETSDPPPERKRSVRHPFYRERHVQLRFKRSCYAFAKLDCVTERPSLSVYVRERP